MSDAETIYFSSYKLAAFVFAYSTVCAGLDFVCQCQSQSMPSSLTFHFSSHSMINVAVIGFGARAPEPVSYQCSTVAPSLLLSTRDVKKAAEGGASPSMVSSPREKCGQNYARFAPRLFPAPSSPPSTPQSWTLEVVEVVFLCRISNTNPRRFMRSRQLPQRPISFLRRS